MNAGELIRECFAAYQAKDRKVVAGLLSDDFTFSSPLDDNLSREQYFEECWPNSEHQRNHHIERLFFEGNEAFVTYECERMDGTKFRNAEFFTVDADKITHVDVYFGSGTVRKSEEAEIHGLIEGTTAAVRAKDAATLASYYASDVLSFDVVNPLQYVGAAEVERRAADWFPRGAGASTTRFAISPSRWAVSRPFTIASIM